MDTDRPISADIHIKSVDYGWIWMLNFISTATFHTREEAIFRSKRGRSRTYPDMSGGRYTQCDSVGGSTGTVQMPIGEYR